jgi:membrane protease YdiL (CAAX protease family)
MMAWVLLAAMLGLVASQISGDRSFPSRFADLIGRTSRRRAIFGWALGTAIFYGWTSVMALLLLRRTDTILSLPWEFERGAAVWGIPLIDADTLRDLGLCLLVGMVLGVGALLLMRRFGRQPIGMAYRSPAAMRESGEWPAAAALALAAGIGEELFFRLALPLLIAMTTGSAGVGFIVSLAVFAVLHRHQGWVGIVATGIVGGLLTLLYLVTGLLWTAMLVHVLIDLNALILRPLMFPRDAAETAS